MISGHVAWWDVGPTPDPPHVRIVEGETIMEPQLIEWGPAHLRDEHLTVEVETVDRPDDN